MVRLVNLLQRLRGDSSTGRPIPVPVDDVFQLLRNRRRRIIICRVSELEPEESTSIGAIAEWIVSIETGDPLGQYSADERKAVYVTLMQTHLEPLSDSGLIEWDPNSGEIRRGEGIDVLADLIEDVSERAAASEAGA